MVDKIYLIAAVLIIIVVLSLVFRKSGCAKPDVSDDVSDDASDDASESEAESDSYALSDEIDDFMSRQRRYINKKD